MIRKGDSRDVQKTSQRGPDHWQAASGRCGTGHKGKTVEEACRALEITVQTYYRWRQKYGGMQPAMAKQLKALQKDNSRLKKVVVDQVLDMEILREAAQGNW